MSGLGDGPRAARRHDGVADDPVFLLRTEGTESSEATGTALPGLPLRVWRFPDDPALPALKRSRDPERVRALAPGALAADHRRRGRPRRAGGSPE